MGQNDARPISYPEVQPPPGLTSHHGYKYVAIVVGLFVLLFGLVLCGFAGWVLQHYSHDSGSKKPKHDASHSSRNVDGQFLFDVNRAECGLKQVGTSPDVYYSDSGQFCVYTVSVKNIGGQPRILLLMSQKAKDATGREYDPNALASQAAGPSKDTFPDLLWSGEETVVTIVFQVPMDIKLVKLIFHDSPFSGGVEVTV